MTGEAEISWNGEAALGRLTGPSSVASPVRAIFLVHRVGATGRLWMTRGLSLRGIDFHDGAIVGCTGFTDLIEGVNGDRQFSVTEWAAGIRQADEGSTPRETVVARALCRRACEAAQDGDWMVNFVPGEGSDTRGRVPESALASLVAALRVQYDEVQTRAWLESAAMKGLTAVVPTDSDRVGWGLGEREAQLLSSIERDGSVGPLFLEMSPEDWASLSVLRGLGLLSATLATEATADVPDSFTAVDEFSEETETVEKERQAPVKHVPCFSNY